MRFMKNVLISALVALWGGCASAQTPANTVLAGPTSGAAAVASYRSLVAADLPALPAYAVCALASASTVDIGATCTPNQFVTVSGNTTITSLGSTAPVGSQWTVFFSGTAQITNSSTLHLPGGQNYTTLGGGGNTLICYVPTTLGTWYCTLPLYNSNLFIDSNGDITIESNGRFTGGSVDVEGSSIPGNGIYHAGAGELDFSSGSTYRMKLDSSGRLLIVYTADQGGGEPLQVNGGIFANGKVTAANMLDSGLSASLPVYTDASKNLTSTAPSGYSAVLSGTTGSIGGSLLAAGACSTGTVSITGVTTSMVVDASPAAGTYPGAGNYWQAYVLTNGTVTVAICAASAGTPVATTYNVRVLQ